MNYLFEFTYELTIGENKVQYVVDAETETKAIQKITGCFHPGFTQRIISTLTEVEANLFKEKKLALGVWRITREATPTMIELNRKQNESMGIVIHKDSFTIMSAM